LHITAQIGIIGLLVLIAMFWMQWRSAKHLDMPMEQALARGLVLTLVIGCMVNSLLLDHAEGLFYAWLSGLLYGGLKYNLSENLSEKFSAQK
jgi:O-antigen ligase